MQILCRKSQVESVRKDSGKQYHFLRDERGMMTVEAALLFPIIVFVLVAIIVAMFFLIDVGVAKSETMRIAVEAADSWKEDGDCQTGKYEDERLRYKIATIVPKSSDHTLSTARTRLTKRIKPRLFMGRLVSSKVVQKGDRIVVTAKIDMLPLPASAFRLFGGHGLDVTAKSEAPLDLRTEYLRIASLLKLEKEHLSD